jgi:hypothetical protein
VNYIREIEGLGTLSQLFLLDIRDTMIGGEEKSLLGRSAQEIVRYCQTKDLNSLEFDFAFFFAGEDREIVRAVRDSLVEKNLKVFFDKDFEWNLLGKDLSERFKQVYGSHSKYVIIFVSKYYPIKDWTNFEFQIARKESLSRLEEFILPIRLDDTPLYGLKSDRGYGDFKTKGVEGISELLYMKLNDFNKRYSL